MENYILEKWIWTEVDFEQMGWHDANVYGIEFKNNLTLDIDYIFKWNEPEVKGFYYTFWIAPCTLVFEKTTELEFDLTQSFSEKWLEIEDIEREFRNGLTRWTIITQQGYISFNADSFK